MQRPPLGVDMTIASRAGCDQDPIDASREDSALTLLSYVWPDQPERLQRLRDSLAIAAELPVDVAQAQIESWLPDQLATPVAGVATVVFHSVVWQYLSETTRALMLSTLAEAGARATADAPLAYLRLEPAPETYFPAELRLTTWPERGSAYRDRVLSTSGFHYGPVTWIS